jgi:hypothetical protein
MTDSDKLALQAGIGTWGDALMALEIEVDYLQATVDRDRLYTAQVDTNLSKLAAYYKAGQEAQDLDTLGLSDQVKVLQDMVTTLSERLSKLENPPVVVPDPQMPMPTPDPIVPPIPPSTLIRSETWTDASLPLYIVEAPPALPGSVTVYNSKLRSVLNTEQALNQAKKCKSEVYLLDKAFTKWTKPFSEPMGVPIEYKFTLQLLSKDTKGLPIDWTKVGSKVVLLQLHGIEDDAEKGFGRNPALALSIEVGGGIPCMRWRGSWSDQATQTDNANTTLLCTVPQVIDTPLDITIRAIWAYTAEGRLKISHGTDTVVDKAGPNMYNDVFGPYWSIGQYLPAMSDPNSVALVKRPREYVVEYGPYTVNSY